MASNFQDNSAQVLAELEQKKAVVLEMIGLKAEGYAKKLCPVDTGTLRNSITHQTDGDTEIIATPTVYAPYVELGTGSYFESPPEWENFSAKRGSGKRGGGIRPRHFLRDAILNHQEEYKQIIENELKK